MQGCVRICAEEAKSHPEWMCQAGEMSWSLKIDKKVAFNVGYGAGTLFRKMQLFEMFWHAEGMKTAYAGEVVFNGEKYIVSLDTRYGYADKKRVNSQSFPRKNDKKFQCRRQRTYRVKRRDWRVYKEI